MSRSPRSTLLGWPLLVLLVGLAAVTFAMVEVHRSVRTNREVAERAEAGYARFVTWSYREHLAETMRLAAREVLGAVNHGDAQHVSPNIPPASSLGHYLPFTPSCQCHASTFGPQPLRFLGFTIGADTMGVGPNFHDEPTVGWLADPADGTPITDPALLRLPADEGRWLAGVLTSTARDGYSDWGYRWHVVDWHGVARVFASTLMPTVWGDTVMYAAEYGREEFLGMLADVLDDPDLLPLADGLSSASTPRVNRDFLHLEVQSPGGTTLFAWEPPANTGVPPARMPPSYGGLVIQAGIVPAMVDALVIGGLPRTRTPLLLALLGLAAALTIAAAVQLRRELRFARARSDFVASVSHELRTPLTQIRLMLDTIRLGRRETPVARDEGLAMIDREVLRLQHLVDGVLRFREADATREVEPRAPTDVVQEVEAVVREWRPLAAPREVRILVDLAPVPTVSMEPGALRQVLINLIDNAVRYGPRQQQVTIRLGTLDERIQLAVEDQGPGVEPGERERIWQDYARGSAARSGAVAGSGIGLAVVRDLVSRHGGSARVESAPGGGARFVVELPAEGP